ncbi:hypothetical protein SRABI106_01885 [Rahnella aquatilis]|nr:hypothetical protein SRABI106_01885 [Rahnella aquatilis]
MTWAQVADRRITGSSIAETHFNAIVVELTHRGIRNILVAQVAAHVVHRLLLQLTQRGIHIHFHQEVNTPTQVEAQLHRLSAQHAQPARRCRREVQCNNKLVAQRFSQRFTCTKLYIRVVKTGKNSAILQSN